MRIFYDLDKSKVYEDVLKEEISILFEGGHVFQPLTKNTIILKLKMDIYEIYKKRKYIKIKMKKAFITGIGGQDGSYLSEYLLNKNYKIYGIIRRNSVVEHQKNRIENLEINKKIDLSYGDMEDRSCLDDLLKKIRPDEIYNLAAQSHVRISFDVQNIQLKQTLWEFLIY